MHLNATNGREVSYYVLIRHAQQQILQHTLHLVHRATAVGSLMMRRQSTPSHGGVNVSVSVSGIIQTGDVSSILGDLALRVVEVRGHCQR